MVLPRGNRVWGLYVGSASGVNTGPRHAGGRPITRPLGGALSQHSPGLLPRGAWRCYKQAGRAAAPARAGELGGGAGLPAEAERISGGPAAHQ